MQSNIDPFNQWGDENQTESHELNERAPFNQNPNTSYMSGDVRESSVESLNIDTMQAKGSGTNGEIRKSYFNEVPTEGSYKQIWKYMEQIKSILAGLLLLLCSGLHTVWAIYQLLYYHTSDDYRFYLDYKIPSNFTKSQTTPTTLTNTTTATTTTTAATTTTTTTTTTAATTTTIAALPTPAALVGSTSTTTQETTTIISATNQTTELDWREGFFHMLVFDERVALMLTIVIYYVGMIVGSLVAGWFLVRVVQKKNVYYIAALVMFASGCVFYGADIGTGWQALLIVGRLLAGISHGITYVTIFVQASENATKDFRRIIVTVIGLTIGLSVFISSAFLIYIPVPEDQRQSGNPAILSETMSMAITSIATIVLCFISVVINFFFSHETVPFLLYHNYREEEAQFAMARLMGEDQNAPVVQQEFSAMREMCHDDYAEFPEGSIFSTIHRRLISIALNARITSAQCLYMLFIVMFVKFIQTDVDLPTDDNRKNLNDTVLQKKMEEILKLVHIYKITVRSVVIIWFIFGVLCTLAANQYNLKRGLHFTTFLVGASMVLFTIFHWIGILGRMFHWFAVLLLTIYIIFLSLPVDVINYSYLMECFPTSTKAQAIALTTVGECLFNAIFICIEMKHKGLGIEFFVIGLLFCVLGFRLVAIARNTNGLSLAAAKHANIEALSSHWWQFYKNK